MWQDRMLWFSDATGAESILEDFLRLGKIKEVKSMASSHENIPENAILFLKTGVCGGKGEAI